MGTARVSVESVRNGTDKIDILVVAWDSQLIDGKEQGIPLGEVALSFPAGTKPTDMLNRIKEAGEQIEEAANQAKKLREELNKELLEEATE